MLPQKNFENLHAVNGYFNAFLVMFSQILFRTFDPNFECFAKYDAFCSHIFDYWYTLLLVLGSLLSKTQKRLEIMKKLYSYTINIFENGWWEDAYPSSYPSGHKLQKTSKESGIFQSLGTISFAFFFTKRQSQKRGPWPTLSPPLNTLLTQDLSNTGKASESNLSLICQGMQKTFLNKSNEIKRAD